MKTQTSLSQWALSVPGATAVLRKHRLDFCCGGKVSLEEACRERNIDVNSVLAELEALEITPENQDWANKPLNQIADHVTEFYHRRLRAMFPELIWLADKVEKVHSDHPETPKGLCAHLQEMHADMLDHMAKEEQILFPLIKNGQGTNAYMPIKVMQEDHISHGTGLKKLRQLAFDFTPPEEACGTWRSLYKGLDLLEMELMDHIHLENNILFMRALQG